MTVTHLGQLEILQHVSMKLVCALAMLVQATLEPDATCVLMDGSFNLMVLAEVYLLTATLAHTGLHYLVHAQVNQQNFVAISLNDENDFAI